jgi:hypothetical protein
MFLHLKLCKANIFTIDLVSMKLWNDYRCSITKFIGVLLVFLYMLMFASYNKLNELLVSLSYRAKF